MSNFSLYLQYVEEHKVHTLHSRNRLWYSGRIQDCHSCDPGSIPGSRASFLEIICLFFSSFNFFLFPRKTSHTPSLYPTMPSSATSSSYLFTVGVILLTAVLIILWIGMYIIIIITDPFIHQVIDISHYRALCTFCTQ